MKLRLTILTACLAFYPLGELLAQEKINVRIGEHGDYTRLVFDWPESVSFDVKNKQSDSLTLEFNKPATIDAGIKGQNLLGLNVLKNDPLSVEVKIPDGAKTRSFPLSSRVVLDIYPVAGAKTAEAKTEEPKPAPAPEPEPKKAAEPVPEPEKKPESPKVAEKPSKVKDVTSETELSMPDQRALERIKEIIQNADGIKVRDLNSEEQSAAPKPEPATEPAPAAASAETQTPPQAAQEPEAKPAKTIAQVAQEQVKPHIFTLSATQAVGMAVFENYGRLWMVTDKDNLLVKPQVNGPNADFFRPIEDFEIIGGNAYRSNVMPDTFVETQGGGLLWNIYVTQDKPEESNPVDPIRMGVKKSAVRSGKIIFPFQSARKVLDLTDPTSGETLKIVTVEDADDFAGTARQFVDFDVLPSPAGIAIRPKVDDLDVKITSEGVEISRSAGLAILGEEQVTGVEKESFADRMSKPVDDRRIFNFAEWRMGGLNALNENENVILSSMPSMTKATQIENLITLAKMELSNGRGAEALGFLEYAQIELPELVQNPEFLSLKGVAEAFAWKTDEAFQDLSSPILENYEEIQIWRAFALADLGDWQQAYDVLPANMSAVRDYPPEVLNRLGAVLAEIYLRGGDVKKAERFFDFKADDELNLANASALKYLQGEALRQQGKPDETKKLWKELAEGRDDLYRVKAGLALTRLLMEDGSIKPAEAIDRLERLRYAWRGDELEAQVNYWLGRTYFESGEYVKGLTIMRDAASLVPDTILGQRIAGDMSSLFTGFFMDEGLKDISPLDSVALYKEFEELVPPGEKGNLVISNLAEHMVQADLLDRAAEFLKYQIDHRLSGDEAARTATRLAAINLIDKNPREAMTALNKAVGFIRQLPEEVATKSRFEELSLLRARALSQDGKTDQALAILETLDPNPEVNRLRADIAWQSGFWDDAAYALEDVILDENISLTRPLSDEHAMLVLQRAVAQNLSGDRIGLANLREKYGEAMSQTNKAQLFDVVTRPRQSAGLADRDTLLSTVAEIDLFGDFLNSYKSVNQSPSN